MKALPEHADFVPPSGSKTLFACPGSAVLQAAFPNKKNDYTDEGTACHWVASECLKNAVPAHGYVNEYIKVSYRDETPRHVLFTDAMADATQGYVDTVSGIAGENLLLIEQRVDISPFVGVEDQFGTADAIILIDEELIVIDAKFGYRPVEVAENPQLLLYALGALARLLEEPEAEEALF